MKKENSPEKKFNVVVGSKSNRKSFRSNYFFASNAKEACRKAEEKYGEDYVAFLCDEVKP